MTREPLVTVASVTAGVTAVLALLVALGIPLTDAQQTAILAVVAVVAPLAVAALTRSRVTPVTPGGARRAGDPGPEAGQMSLERVLVVVLLVALVLGVLAFFFG